jgi:hypothetical protein
LKKLPISRAVSSLCVFLNAFLDAQAVRGLESRYELDRVASNVNENGWARPCVTGLRNIVTSTRLQDIANRGRQWRETVIGATTPDENGRAIAEIIMQDEAEMLVGTEMGASMGQIKRLLSSYSSAQQRLQADS